ncbi:hypothetical protein SNEBB_000074 [Seison nebaliae]|nr:hypothetical protein SNEBB_000074 [Seison nebaliae]
MHFLVWEYFIQEAGKSSNRIDALKHHLLQIVYSRICRSLQKSDRLLFAVYLAKGMMPSMFQENEWEYFCDLLIGKEEGSSRTSNVSWIPEDRRIAAETLKNNLSELWQKTNLSDSSTWSEWMTNDNCELNFPPSVKSSLSPFQQLMIVKCIRPDRQLSAMGKFAKEALNIEQLSPPDTNLKDLYKTETINTEPIMFIVSPGSDPSQELQELAKSTIGLHAYHEIAMGQGQTEAVLHQLHQCASKGEWLCLKNIHLVHSFLSVLEKEINVLEPHENFRLWLTTESLPKFPIILLQSVLKISYESPPGIKKNLQRSYDTWSKEFLSTGNELRANSLFALAWFHAIVCERRNYIPQGWTKFYEYSSADLRAASDVITALFKRSKSNIQWNYIHGLFVQAIYGGRVDNTFDRDVMETYLEQYFNQSKLNSGRLAEGISLPNSTNIDAFKTIIKNLPEQDSPQIFGLPSNIDRSQQRTVSANVVKQLKLVLRPETSTTKFDKKQWTSQLRPYFSLWKQLISSSDLHKRRLSAPDENDDPVAAFVLLEVYNAITLVQLIHKSIMELDKLLKGNTLLTGNLHKLASALLRQETPGLWQSKWDGPEDPMSYMKTVSTRAEFIDSKWVTAIKDSSLLNKGIDLSELLHPETFVNALRQKIARAIKVPMDELELSASWSPKMNEAKYSIKVEGLQIEGATFDGIRLTENSRSTASINPIPSFQLSWIPKKSTNNEQSHILLPLYFNESREKIVMKINVPFGGGGEEAKNKWILSGVALFLRSF